MHRAPLPDRPADNRNAEGHREGKEWLGSVNNHAARVHAISSSGRWGYGENDCEAGLWCHAFHAPEGGNGDAHPGQIAVHNGKTLDIGQPRVAYREGQKSRLIFDRGDVE
jgi:hypothetical protein